MLVQPETLLLNTSLELLLLCNYFMWLQVSLELTNDIGQLQRNHQYGAHVNKMHIAVNFFVDTTYKISNIFEWKKQVNYF